MSSRASSLMAANGKRNGEAHAGIVNGVNLAAATVNGVRQNGHQLNGTKLNGSKQNGSKQQHVDQLHANGHQGANGHKVEVEGLKANGAATPTTVSERVSGAARKGTGNLVKQDRVLVDRCLSGEAAAWSQMYARFHGSLLASIRAFLGRAGHDMHLVDEISARVWYALVRNGFELLAKFDPGRGCRLSTFLSVLGKSEARLLLRSERRRKTRECVASRPEIELADATCGGALADDEFLATLSPRERSFYFDILVCIPEGDSTSQGADESDYSRQNQWQLRHRVRKKLEQFLE